MKRNELQINILWNSIMKKIGSVIDVLRFGIEKEIEANIFYNMLAEYAHDPQVIGMCRQFAEEELMHKEALELEIFKLGGTINEDNQKFKITKPLDYMIEQAKVMKMDYEDLLVMAMSKEKESFRFYLELYAIMTRKDFRDVLMELAEEEARHKLRFEIQYDIYVSGKNKNIQ